MIKNGWVTIDTEHFMILYWLYKRMETTLNCFPSSMEDFLNKKPDWFELDENSDDSFYYQMKQKLILLDALYKRLENETKIPDNIELI